MKPKEKAIELVTKFSFYVGGEAEIKKCALMAVDEILNQDKGAFDLGEIHYHFEYWHNVKQEIYNL